MRSTEPPEDFNTRPNREIWRDALGGFKAALGVLLLCLGLTAAFVRIPTNTDFARGEVTGVIASLSEAGARQELLVTVNGQTRTAAPRAQLAYPPEGAVICLRQTDYWPFGQRSYAQTDMRFCDDANPTQGVE